MGEARRRKAMLGDKYGVDQVNSHRKPKSEAVNIDNADVVLMELPVETAEPTFESVANLIIASANQAAALNRPCYLFLTNDDKGYPEELRTRVYEWSQSQRLPADVHLAMMPCK